MIDLDKLERRAMACADSTTKICVVSSLSIVELITRLREAEKDAARYKWLRDRAHTVTGVTPCAFAMKDGDLMEDWNGQYGLLCMGALDAAVDEAISENQA